MAAGTRHQVHGGKWRTTSFSCPTKLKISGRAGSGFKLNVLNLRSLTINLGEHTTAPFAAVGVSVDGSDFFTVNASAGANVIPLPTRTGIASLIKPSVVRINVEGWQDNRINLESVALNSVSASLGLFIILF